MQSTMNGMRTSQSAPSAAPPNLDRELWFVGNASQATVEKALARAPAGDFVIRASARTPGAFVLMLKLTAVTGIQKRLLFSQGSYRIDGGMETYSSINQLLKSEPMAQRPARDLVVGVANGGTSSKRKSGREMLEHAMNLAEAGQADAAMQLVQAAVKMGVSERNVKVTREYVQSFLPAEKRSAAAPSPSKASSPKAAPGRDTLNNGPVEADPFGNLELNVNVRENEDSARLAIGGVCRCEVTSEAKLVLQAASGGKKHTWPLGYLRRYGRDPTVFYFESGRRCPSGPATIYLETVHGEKIFQVVDKAVKEVIKAAQEKEDEKAAMMAKLREEKRQQEIIEDMQRKAAIAKHAASAMIEAKMRVKAQEARDRRAQKKRESEEKKKQEARAALEKDRSNHMKRQQSVHAARAAKAAELGDVSKKNVSKMDVKEAGGTGMFGEKQPVWGEGKSKIWLALNPQPLAYQTAADRREKEDGADDLGVLGQRSYAFANEMNRDDDDGSGAMPERRPSMRASTTFEGEEEINDMADMSDGEISDLEDDDDDDEEEEEGDYNDDDLALDTDMMSQLEKGRAQREVEEKKRREELAAQYKREQQVIDDERNKELAIIEARRKLEEAAKNKEKDAAVKEAQTRMATELSFDFSWG